MYNCKYVQHYKQVAGEQVSNGEVSKKCLNEIIQVPTDLYFYGITGITYRSTNDVNLDKQTTWLYYIRYYTFSYCGNDMQK